MYLKFITVLIFLPVFVFTQSMSIKNYSFVHYTTDNGLPQNSVKDIEFDKHGYCWLATEVGAVRYDGLSFKNIKLDPKKPSRIGRFSKTVDNDLYIFNDIWNKYLIRLDKLGKWSVSEDSNKNVDYSSHGFAYYQDKVSPLKRKYNVPHFGDGLAEHTVLGTKKDGFYKLGLSAFAFFDSNQYIYHQDIQTRGLQNYFLLENDLLLWEDKLNKFSIYRNGKRILHRVSIYSSDNKPFHYAANKIKLLWHDNCVFLYYKNILYQLKYENNKLIATLVLNNILIENPISIAYHRAQGLYFIGTLTDGLYIFKQTQFKTIGGKQGQQPEDQIFYAQAELGNQLFANGFLFDSFGRSTFMMKDVHKFNLLQHSKNEVWLFRKHYGHMPELYSFLHNRSKIVQYDSFYDITKGMFRTSCDRKILFLCAESMGEIENFKRKPILYNNNRAFTTLVEYNCDTLIIGTKRGLFFYNQKLKKIGGFFSLGEVRTLQKDRENNVWIGTYLYGYFIWNPQRGIFKPQLDKNNRLESVHAFYFDKREYVWMSTNNGLIRVKRQDIFQNKQPKYEVFDKSDGFLTNEFNGGCHPSVIELKDGRVSFPSMNGLVIFHPDAIQPQSLQTNIYIQRIKTNHRENDMALSLLFNKEVRHIEFEFSTPYFGNRDNINYEYTEDTIRGEWIAMSGNTIVFDNMKSGSHRLYIRIAEHPSSHREILFVIEPYFYETIWFQLAILLGIILSFYFIQRYRIQRIYIKNQELEQRIAEKTSQLNMTIEKLEVSESEMRSLVVIQEKIMKIVLHDMQSPLQFLRNIAEDAVTAVKSKNLDIIDEKLHVLTRSISSITNFTATFFNWIYYQRRGIKPNYSFVNIDEIFKELLDIYEHSNSKNRISLTPCHLNFYTDRNILSVVLKNILDNADK